MILNDYGKQLKWHPILIFSLLVFNLTNMMKINLLSFFTYVGPQIQSKIPSCSVENFYTICQKTHNKRI